MVRVNGVVIGEAEIAAELQHHPAPSHAAAWQAAARALVVRRLLLDEARARGLDAGLAVDRLPEDAAIDRLLAEVIVLPEADEASCRRWYDANRPRFRTPELWEASHILIAADPADPAVRAAARAEAEALLAEVLAEPAALARLARLRSDCPSARDGGRLGQVGRGGLVPEVETFLAALEPGQTCPRVVESRYGMHILQLHARAPGRELPFETVRERVAAYLREAAWRRAAHQYVALLAGRARIEGLTMAAADSPLVQ